MTRGKVAVCESTVGQAETRGKGGAIDDDHDDDDEGRSPCGLTPLTPEFLT